ncbi:GNAT family protein [Methanobrevibacter gottschalkii]
MNEARKEKVKIVPSCSYAKKLMFENPKECKDVL